ncbi:MULTISPECIES: 3-deoxy-manno-octulosonate cytidylyltransferase [unclassified Leisingera]|uniref:3-deoxy-manno-octulosonate cytidylyltransferase n=1 Tax=unclassified Leisingera TaxID=2614906 RepID=UPI0010107A40|nr:MULTISPECIES: 3-deoxy-manno-octulosonate cytidylyltransferase [unclassified Leisingera]MCF6430579.1 3-deoxy-manno-octulosonate cytidylyltransferase [Leisingera sp. MMG026]QAX32099.1 3-deoxy-manno-octulosonate cytidylyltransferase [Leisingera sp. NJS204]
MTACVIIPARYASTRYPGKPLVPLLGKPMVLWVAELSARAVGREHVYVATEDDRISEVVEAAGFKALMTGKDALTGTDRLAEAAQMIDYDIYVNVQGDEPLVNPADIKRCVDLKAADPSLIVNGFAWVSDEEDPHSVNIPKVITTEDDVMVYMSRLALPGFKDPGCAPERYKKQVCIYGFTREELQAFQGFGRKGALERSEDIEILRFQELGRKIVMYETSPGTMAVDVPEDVAPVEAALRRLWNL